MNFEQALPLHKAGRKIKRAGWENYWQENFTAAEAILADDWIVEPEKWEPAEGDWYISSSGGVCSNHGHSLKSKFGLTRPTKELAEKARDEVRVFNRLLAYRDEFAPGFEPNCDGFREPNHYVAFNHESGKWGLGYNTFEHPAGIVYMPYLVAEVLINKLNSGEVVL